MRSCRSGLVLLLAVVCLALPMACGGGGGGVVSTIVLSSVAPPTGPQGGNTPLTLTGSGFSGPATVTVGGVAATAVVVASANIVTCLTPAGTPGAPVDVVLTTPGGSATSTGAFTYIAAPTVTGVQPNMGPAAGGTPVTVSGTGFNVGVTAVRFNGVLAGGVSVGSDTSLTCTTPAGSGSATVSVETAGGIGSLAAAFTYQASLAPTVTAVSPTSGFSTGGMALTLTGTNFQASGAGTNTVQIGGAPASSIVTVDDTTITCTDQGGAPSGAIDVRVSNNNGSGILGASYEHFGWPPNLLANNTRVNTGTPGTDHALVSQILCKGATVYIVWTQGNTGSNRDSYFARSTDGGMNWSTPVRLNTNGQNNSESLGPRICCSGQTLHVVFIDDRNSAQAQNDFDVYYQRSTNGGTTWLANDVRIQTNTAGSSNSRYHDICCDGQNVYVCWTDDRAPTQNFNVRFQKSTDGGTSWLANDVQVDDTVGGGSRGVLQMACCGQNIYLVWGDTRNNVINTDIYANASSNGGTSWLASDVRLNTDTAGTAIAFLPRICCDGSTAHVVWYDTRSGQGDVRYSRTTNGGTSWSVADARIDTDTAGVGNSVNPAICCEGSNVYVVWADGRNGSGRDTYFNKSTNAGVNWLANDVRISTDTAGQALNHSPKICCSGGVLWVAWEDDRNSVRGDIYYTCSKDGGTNWLANDVKLNDDTGDWDQNNVQLCCDGARCYFGWVDTRHNLGIEDLYTTATTP